MEGYVEMQQQHLHQQQQGQQQQQHERVFQIKGHLVDLWLKVALEKGFHNDSQVAGFLLQHYVRWQQSHFPEMDSCVHCKMPLLLYCFHCQLLLSGKETESVPGLLNNAQLVPVSQSAAGMVEMEGEAHYHDLMSQPGSCQAVMSDHDNSLHTGQEVNLAYAAKSHKQGDEFVFAADQENSDNLVYAERQKLSGKSACLSMRGSSDSLVYTERSKQGGQVAFSADGADSVQPEKSGDFSEESEHFQTEGRSLSTEGGNIGTENLGSVKSEGEVDSRAQLAACSSASSAERQQTKCYPCSQCEMTLKTKHSLQLHTKRVHGAKDVFVCDVCDEHFASSCLLKAHRQSHKNVNAKLFSCSKCGASFTRIYLLNRHFRKHTGEKPFVCSLCNAAFLTNFKLKNHMRCHTGEKPYRCQHCDKMFAQTTYLKEHLRTHTGERPFVCQVCGAAFTQWAARERHTKTHSTHKPNGHIADLPFMCAVCGKRFSESGKLTSHMRVHTDERPHVCSHPGCTSAFKSRTDLKNHSWVHSQYKPHVCQFCGAAFIQKTNLTKHVRRHTNERPYSCATCTKAFKSKSALNMHNMMHRDERPWVCDTCEARFRRPSNLRVHMQKMHGIESQAPRV